MEMVQTGGRPLTRAALAGQRRALEDGRTVTRKELSASAREAAKALALRPSLRLVLSELVAAWGEQWQSSGEWRAHTSAMRTADEHAVWLVQLMKMEGIDPKSITDAIIGSVVPNANFNLRRLCTRYFNTEPMFIGDENVKHGIKIKGVGAGADRICNSVGASLMFPRTPVIVVDFGTATNFDVVDEEGSYCGGAIAPGPNLSIEALVNAAALLPRIIVEKPKNVIGTTTVACMHTGVFWGYVGLIEGLVKRIKDEFGKPMKVVSTGGLAPVFEGSISGIDQIAPDITARGLIEIFRRSKK